ncbi:DUF952 domain-containing protein [Calothrix sp. PCC 6303]|uniref:DUF952 domain-containing protein n=1 Tax=Calothrix sp. PCC 6303 TaxID=1170562 RepID=UPI0002A0339B|nr:DUF952 domain-containing protein [Calothrix sp. PCC 6303]AFY99857.1 protein of unknown function DUF952 [Calothrix sp. PCC 6303]
MNPIYHITERQAWENAKVTGSYSADSLKTEGFIHCSTLSQVAASANRFFKNQSDLVILHIDPNKVKPEIRNELANNGELFPHIYGELNTDAVFKVVDLEVDEEGLFKLPDEM